MEWAIGEAHCALGLAIVLAQEGPSGCAVAQRSPAQQLWAASEPHNHAVLHEAPVLAPDHCPTASRHDHRLEGHELLQDVHSSEVMPKELSVIKARKCSSL